MTTQEKLLYLIKNNLINAMDAISYAKELNRKLVNGDRTYISIRVEQQIDRLYEKYTKKG